MQPVEEVIRTTTDAGLKRKLQAAQEIREFASTSCSFQTTTLTVRMRICVGRTSSGTSLRYPFSMQPRQWCFAVVGCVAYRGYYESEARAFAEQLRADGFDVRGRRTLFDRMVR